MRDLPDRLTNRGWWFETTIGCFIDLVEASKHYPQLKKQWVEFLGEKPDEDTTRVELGETTAV